MHSLSVDQTMEKVYNPLVPPALFQQLLQVDTRPANWQRQQQQESEFFCIHQIIMLLSTSHRTPETTTALSPLSLPQLTLIASTVEVGVDEMDSS